MQSNSNLQTFYRSYGDGNGLFYMGHASVLCVFGGKRILFDPVILSEPYNDAWAFFPPQVSDPSVFDVDAVVVSHIHQDHYDVKYLKALEGRAKVIVLGGRASFENDLRAKEIQNLQIVDPETATEILPGVSIFGVLHETNGIDSSCIVFNRSFCVYHGNDNYCSATSIEKFKKLVPKIDVACIPYAYIHWYPFLMVYDHDQVDQRGSEGERLVKMYMDDCINATRILKPEVVIPFGANLLLDDGDCYSKINLAVKTPIEFCEYAKLAAPDVSGVIKPMLAGDYCGLDDTGMSLTINRAFDGQSYRQQANEFLSHRPVKQLKQDWQAIDEGAFMMRLNERLAQIDDTPNHSVHIEMTYLGEPLKVEIDLATHKAAWTSRFKREMPFHHFKLDELASGAWLNGQRFEEILGMRRFTLHRRPDDYSPQILRWVSTVF